MPYQSDHNLDVGTPEEVAQVLRATAELYYDSANELSSSWQDKNAGRCWKEFAKILEAAALKCDKAVADYV
jgi:hypothetical protein